MNEYVFDYMTKDASIYKLPPTPKSYIVPDVRTKHDR